MLKKFVRRSLYFAVWIALMQAIFVAIQAIRETDRNTLSLGEVAAAFFISGIVSAIGWYLVDRQVGTEHIDGDEREYVNSAWLCGVFGVLLMLIEAVFEFRRLAHLEIEFIFEDPLLGASALCMLAEEVRLLRNAKITTDRLGVGPGSGRVVIPKPD